MSEIRIYCPMCGTATARAVGIDYVVDGDETRTEALRLRCETCGAEFLLDANAGNVQQRMRAARTVFDATSAKATAPTGEHRNRALIAAGAGLPVAENPGPAQRCPDCFKRLKHCTCQEAV